MPTPEDYDRARAIALEALGRMDIERCSLDAGGLREVLASGESRIALPYLGRTYHLVVDKNSMAFEEGDGLLKVPDQVVLLHYLITAGGAPLEHRWITFREVPSGPFYYPSFVKRAVVPLVRGFGQRPQLLRKLAGVLGEVVDGPGDQSLKVLALPRVPVVLALWRGDEEFPPEGNVYFDGSISSYLPTEDIAYLAGSVVYKALAIARGMDA